MDKNLAHIWNTMGENSFLVLLFILVVLFLFMNKLEKEVDLKLNKLNKERIQELRR